MAKLEIFLPDSTPEDRLLWIGLGSGPSASATPACVLRRVGGRFVVENADGTVSNLDSPWVDVSGLRVGVTDQPSDAREPMSEALFDRTAVAPSQLLVSPPNAPGQVHAVLLPATEAARFVIGRSSAKNCQLVLAYKSVSRVHARIWFENGAYHVEDLQSKRGTAVNGVRITQPTRLQHGDKIRFGKVDAEFCDLLKRIHQQRHDPDWSSYSQVIGAAELDDDEDAVSDNGIEPASTQTPKPASRLSQIDDRDDPAVADEPPVAGETTANLKPNDRPHARPMVVIIVGVAALAFFLVAYFLSRW